MDNTNPLHLRDDIGKLWENYCIVERMKYNQSKSPLLPQLYFWRSYEGQEIDLIEERNGKLSAFEMKYGGGNISRSARQFFEVELGGNPIELISKENFTQWLQ